MKKECILCLEELTGESMDDSDGIWKLTSTG